MAVTNHSRARAARYALGAFIQEKPTDEQDAVRDLIADLGHYCDEEGLDYTTELAAAERHWRAECAGEE